MASDRDAGSSFATNASGIGNQRIGTTKTSAANNQAHLFNLVNQRKTPHANNSSGNPQQQMMMTTQFFNSSQNNQNNLSSVSKTIAQAKLRKQRQTRGASNPVNDMSVNGNQAEYYNNNNNQNQFNSTSYPASHSRKKSINNQNVGTLGNISNLNNNGGQFNNS